MNCCPPAHFVIPILFLMLNWKVHCEYCFGFWSDGSRNNQSLRANRPACLEITYSGQCKDAPAPGKGEWGGMVEGISLALFSSSVTFKSTISYKESNLGWRTSIWCIRGICVTWCGTPLCYYLLWPFFSWSPLTLQLLKCWYWVCWGFSAVLGLSYRRGYTWFWSWGNNILTLLLLLTCMRQLSWKMYILQDHCSLLWNVRPQAFFLLNVLVLSCLMIEKWQAHQWATFFGFLMWKEYHC